MDHSTGVAVCPAEEGDIEQIASILAESFAELFRAEFGLRRSEVESLLADLYRCGVLPLGKVLVAGHAGAIAGIAVVSLPPPGPASSEGPWLVRAWKVFRKRMGWKGALRAAIGSALLRYYFAGRTPVTGVAYIDSLAVAPPFRRQGVGRFLIESCADSARRRGCREIALHVLVAKAEARRLYESCGFQVEPERRFIARVSDRLSAGLGLLRRRSADNQRSVLMVKQL